MALAKLEAARPALWLQDLSPALMRRAGPGFRSAGLRVRGLPAVEFAAPLPGKKERLQTQGQGTTERQTLSTSISPQKRIPRQRKDGVFILAGRLRSLVTITAVLHCFTNCVFPRRTTLEKKGRRSDDGRPPVKRFPLKSGIRSERSANAA